MVTKSILGDKRFQNNVFHPTIDGLNDKNEKKWWGVVFGEF